MTDVTLTGAEWAQLDWMLSHFTRIRQGAPEEPLLWSLRDKLEVLRCEPPGQAMTASIPLAPDIDGAEKRRRTIMAGTRTITPKRRTAPQPPKAFDEDEEILDPEEDEENEDELVEQAAPRRTAARAAKAAPAAKSKPASKAKAAPAAKSKPASKAKAAPKSDGPKAVKRAPKASDEPLTGDDLIERKRLAGAGRSQEAGTAFGSRWTDEERKELKRLCESLNGAEAATAFVKKYPHRTVQGALYQISRNGY